MTLLHTPSYESQLSQAERLALCAGRFSPLVLAPDAVRIDPASIGEVHPVTGRPVFVPPWERKGTPNRAYVGVRPRYVANDASEEESSEDASEEDELKAFAVHKRRDAMREHSLLMPSQRGYAAAWQEARDYGFANE